MCDELCGEGARKRPLALHSFFSFLKFFNVLFSTLLHMPPLDSIVSEDVEIEPRTVASLVVAVVHSARSHPQNLARSHPKQKLR
jgi:hypothetical protein